mmetsp:Transcript_35021/g.56749  ORF Transcript_35021/g.56749 Transcript_35021/m.56749 type:complete len:184 (+) Transcript_35021:271-822(+)
MSSVEFEIAKEPSTGKMRSGFVFTAMNDNENVHSSISAEEIMYGGLNPRLFQSYVIAPNNGPANSPAELPSISHATAFMPNIAACWVEASANAKTQQTCETPPMIILDISNVLYPGSMMTAIDARIYIRDPKASSLYWRFFPSAAPPDKRCIRTILNPATSDDVDADAASWPTSALPSPYVLR